MVNPKNSVPPLPERSIYNRSLLLAFIANVFQLIAVSLLFRYSDFVQELGGDELDLGWIVGIAAIGAVSFRLFQGSAVDRFGPNLIWIVSILGEIAALAWHLRIESVDGVEIYLARMLFSLSLAGTFGAWLSFVSLQAPRERVAEVIGVIGASGFVGMAIGPTIGDWVFHKDVVERNVVNLMFYVSILMLCCALASTFLACWYSNRDKTTDVTLAPRPLLNPLRIIRQNNPGFILVVGALMGLTIGFPGTFLRPMAEALNIGQIKTFFIVYNVVAFSSRLCFRRAPQVLGLRNTILLGYLFMAIGMLLYLPLKTSAGFWLPAIFAGMGHSFLFPSVVAACTENFPTYQRGVATNLILAMYDLGVLIGMPVIGFVVTQARHTDLPPYPSALMLVCATIVVISIAYFVFDLKSEKQLRKPPLL